MPEPHQATRGGGGAERAPKEYSRRGMLLLLGCGMGLGMAAGERFFFWVATRGRHRQGRPGEGQPAPVAPPDQQEELPPEGTLEWALALARGPEERLWSWAFNYCRVAVRYTDRTVLLDGLERIVGRAVRTAGRDTRADGYLLSALRGLLAFGEGFRLHEIEVAIGESPHFSRSAMWLQRIPEEVKR